MSIDPVAESNLKAIAHALNLKLKDEMGIELEVGRYFIYRKDGEGRGVPVKIVGGCYLDPTYGRVSNWWDWQRVRSDGRLGRKDGGYGGGSPHFEKISRARAIRLARSLAR